VYPESALVLGGCKTLPKTGCTNHGLSPATKIIILITAKCIKEFIHAMDITIAFLFMGFNRKLFITILCCLYISHIGIAQYVPKKIKQHLTNCYDSSIGKLNMPIETGGYYLFKEVEKRCYGYGLQMICEDTFKFGVIFYNDGTYIDDINGKEKMNFEEYAGYI